MKLFAASLVCSLFLFGCSTPYQTQGLTGGFTDLRLAPDTWRIVFRGNGYSSQERAQDLALLRACELTVTNGFNYFTLVKHADGVSTSSYSTPSSSSTSTQVYGNQIQSQTTTYPGGTYYINRPYSGMLVKAFREKPADNTVSYDARYIGVQLAQRYKLPPLVAEFATRAEATVK